MAALLQDRIQLDCQQFERVLRFSVQCAIFIMLGLPSHVQRSQQLIKLHTSCSCACAMQVMQLYADSVCSGAPQCTTQRCRISSCSH